MEDIDDFIILDVQNSIPGVAEMFHIIPKTFIMILLDGPQGLSCGRTLVRAVEVPNEHGT
jgi:hypothetical protein